MLKIQSKISSLMKNYFIIITMQKISPIHNLFLLRQILEFHYLKSHAHFWLLTNNLNTVKVIFSFPELASPGWQSWHIKMVPGPPCPSAKHEKTSVPPLSNQNVPVHPLAFSKFLLEIQPIFESSDQSSYTHFALPILIIFN